MAVAGRLLLSPVLETGNFSRCRDVTLTPEDLERPAPEEPRELSPEEGNGMPALDGLPSVVIEWPCEPLLGGRVNGRSAGAERMKDPSASSSG